MTQAAGAAETLEPPGYLVPLRQQPMGDFRNALSHQTAA